MRMAARHAVSLTNPSSALKFLGGHRIVAERGRQGQERRQAQQKGSPHVKG